MPVIIVGELIFIIFLSAVSNYFYNDVEGQKRRVETEEVF